MPRKYVVLICGMLIQICLSGVYGWTVFVPTLRQTHGLTTAQTQAVFGTAIVAWTLAMNPGGRALLRFGPRIVSGLAGLLFLCGGGISAASNGNFYLLLQAIRQSTVLSLVKEIFEFDHLVLIQPDLNHAPPSNCSVRANHLTRYLLLDRYMWNVNQYVMCWRYTSTAC